MKVSIHTNSEAPIGTLVETLIAQAEEVFIASAYISSRAISTLTARIQERKETKLTVDVLFGLDTETDTKTIRQVYEAAGQMPDQLNVRYTPHRVGRLFHPKAYYFRVGSLCHILITSANWTQAGQNSNEELYCYLEVSATHEAGLRFNAVRQAWCSEPSSKVLDQKIIDALDGVEYYKQQLEKHQQLFGEIISDVGVKDITVPPIDHLASLRTVLANGYLITPSFSLSSLAVSVQDILKPTDTGTPDKENQVVVFQNRFSASVSLLPGSAVKDFNDLQRNARDLCEAYSISIEAGQYVPTSAHAALKKSLDKVGQAQKKLIAANIKKRAIISQHLESRLEPECRAVWKTLNPTSTLPFPDNLLPQIQERVKEQWQQIERDPTAALRFAFAAYPHPLVLENVMPDSLAWKLQENTGDTDLFHVIITLLAGQVKLIQGVTQWKRPSVIKRDYERVRLLVSIKGKAVDSLLRLLSAYVRDSQITKRGQTAAEKQTLQQKKVDSLTKKANEHLKWLTDLDSSTADHIEAIKILRQEYNTL